MAPRLKTVGASVATPGPSFIITAQAAPFLSKPTPIQLVKEDKKDGRMGELGRYKQQSPFLQYQTTVPILPEDFKIGKLENLNSQTVMKKEILAVLRKFMVSFMKGEIAEDTIFPDDLVKVRHTIKAAIDEKTHPVRYRVGGIMDTGEPAVPVRIRLWSLKNSVEGDVYFIRDNEKWLITDVIANFIGLESEPGGNQEKFLPQEYKAEY